MTESYAELQREVKVLRNAKRRVSGYRNLQAERQRLISDIRGPKPRSFGGFLASAVSSGVKAGKTKKGKKVYGYMERLAKQNQW